MRILAPLFPAIISALLLVASFEPFGFWFLIYGALLPLLLATRTANASRTALLHALTGALLGIGVYYSAIARSFLIFLAIVGVFVLVFVVWGLLVREARKQWPAGFGVLLAPALLWTGIETITTSTFVSVPINLGASQAGQPLLIQSAAWFGVHGVSFVIVLVNTAISAVFEPARATTGTRSRALAIGVALSAIAISLVIGYVRLATPVPSPSIKVATVQPAIPSAVYRYGWRVPAYRNFARETVDALTARALASGARMVFWSEGGNGYLNMRVADLRERLYRTAREHAVDLIVSSEDLDSEGRRFNTVFAINKDGRLVGRYDKSRLVPFVESTLTAGAAHQPLPASAGRLGVAICFESTLPAILRRATAAGAELLFVTSSDATFKRSALVFAHAQLAVFRAIENGRWLVRAANTGPSLIISPRGEITARSNFYARDILVGEVAALQVTTFYTRTGYLFLEGLALFVVGFAVFRCWAWTRTARLNAAAPTGRRARRTTRAVSPSRLIMLTKTACVAGGAIAVLSLALVAGSVFGVQRSSTASLGFLPTVREFLDAGAPSADTVNDGFLQAKKNTCGAAALAYVLSNFGRETTENEILEHVALESRGISLLSLKRATPAFGFDAVGVRENYTALRDEALPAIAYINDSHYVVVNEVSASEVMLFDPALGDVRVSRNVFERQWNGYLLLVRVQPIMAQSTDDRVASVTVRENIGRINTLLF